MPKVKFVSILLVTDSLLKQYLLLHLSCCTFFSTPKSAKMTLGLKQAAAINPNTAEFIPYTNLPTGMYGHLTTGTSLKKSEKNS